MGRLKKILLIHTDTNIIYFGYVHYRGLGNELNIFHSKLQQKLKRLKLIERKYCQHGKYNKQTDPMIL